MGLEGFKLSTPLPDTFPDSWTVKGSQQDYLSFRNLDHFKYTVSKLTQKQDNKCDITYADALKKLINGESDFPEGDQEEIRNLVRSNLHKRGLITEEVYENYRYDVGGTVVGFDVGKYAAGEPDCAVVPSREYIDFFYELYISISYSSDVSDSHIRKNTAKLLATIEELERRHIFIKVVLVLPASYVTKERDTEMFSSIPLFSHKDIKSVSKMSSVINERLLRKFYFAILEKMYGDNLASGYGTVKHIEGCMNIGEQFNEIEFYREVVEEVGAGE